VIVLDASVLVGFFERGDVHHDAAAELLNMHAGEPWAASTITVAELLVGPARAGEMKLAAASSALEALGIDELPVPHDSGAELARLRATSGLKLPDCCVLQAAHHAAAKVATFDDRLAGAARARGLEVLPGH
jgi:predicted nucleic acid-binding protein